MVKIRSIEHIAVAADDPEKEAAWYRDTLGFELVYQGSQPGTGKPFVFIKDPSGEGLIELIPQPDENPVDHHKISPAHYHIALVVDDFDAAYDTLLASGVRFEGPRPTGQGQKLAFFRDPEGVPLQLVYRPDRLK